LTISYLEYITEALIYTLNLALKANTGCSGRYTSYLHVDMQPS
jgi:hypothetical protein